MKAERIFDSFTVPMIERDVKRFRDILQGKVRKDLGKYIGGDELIGKEGDQIVSIPVPTIDTPRFRFGENQGGVGQGEGNEGDVIGRGEGEGGTQAGDQPGQHILEVTVDELLDWIEEEIELENLKPSKMGNIRGGVRYREKGEQKARRPGFKFRKSYLKALKDGHPPKMAAILAHSRPYAIYRSAEKEEIPTARGVIIFIADVSASMDAKKKTLMRRTANLYRALLKRHYPHLEWRFIAHDTVAAEVDEEVFFRLRQGGGTKISSGYHYCQRMVETDYAEEDWNIFVVHYSDGENWSEEDTGTSLRIVTGLLPVLRSFAFVQTGGTDDDFRGKMERTKERHEKREDEEGRLVTIKVNEYEEVVEAVRTIAGKKKKEAG